MIYGDKKYEQFIKRMYEALKREKFNRKEPYNDTPSNIASAKKFYFTLNDKDVFICIPNLLFESLIFELWYIAQQPNEIKSKPEELIRKLYNNKKHLLEEKTLIRTYDEFYATILEESFIYFDDLENQYFFNLFRSVDEQQFTGGFLHSLTRHFKDFNKYIEKSNGDSEFNRSTFLINLVECSIFGENIKKEVKPLNNFSVKKKLEINEKKFLYSILYWDNYKELFLLTSAYISNR